MMLSTSSESLYLRLANAHFSPTFLCSCSHLKRAVVLLSLSLVLLFVMLGPFHKSGLGFDPPATAFHTFFGEILLALVALVKYAPAALLSLSPSLFLPPCLPLSLSLSVPVRQHSVPSRDMFEAVYTAILQLSDIHPVFALAR